MDRIKDYIKTHKHILFLLYGPIYFIWFFSLEAWTDRNWTIVHCHLDDLIPFVPVFIIPYYLWFAYMAFFCAYFYLKLPVKDTVKLYSTLVISMTVTLIIYTIWPNALNLRPADVSENGFFSGMVARLYKTDTDTNVCPSLHVLNTLTVLAAYFSSGKFKGKHLQNAAFVLISVLICASTVFLKQHSVLDVLAAFGLFIACQILVYVPKWEKVFKIK